MKKSYLLFVGIIALSYIAVVSCSNENTKKENKDLEQPQNVVSSEKIAEDVDKIVKEIPTPFELTTLLNKAGASYIIDICNKPDNKDKYGTSKSKAINLGVYSADLCYASTYNKKQEITLFLAATQSLTEKLEIANVYNASIVERIKKNTNNKDSLINIISSTFVTTYEILNKSNKMHITALTMAGGCIEGIYLATQLASFAKDSKELKNIIVKQKEQLTKVSSLLGLLKDNQDVKETFDKINELKAIFDGVTDTLTDDQFSQISKKAETIRNEFVN